VRQVEPHPFPRADRCTRLHSRPRPFPAKHRGHRGQTGESQRLCGLQADGAPGTDRGHIGDRQGTLTHLYPFPVLATHGPAAPPRPLAHFAGMRRKGTSPGASPSRPVPLWITFQTTTRTRMHKKQAMCTSLQPIDLFMYFPIMCNTCSITHIRQRALCIVNVLFYTYSAHYRENLVS
jgi:hypothetical protein